MSTVTQTQAVPYTGPISLLVSQLRSLAGALIILILIILILLILIILILILLILIILLNWSLVCFYIWNCYE